MSTPESSALNPIRFCFYGAGSMAEALFRGLIETRLAVPGQITVMNRQNRERLLSLQRQYGIIPAVTDEAKRDALQGADVIVLAMKPKDAAEALRPIAPLLRREQLIVSVIAGLSLETIGMLIGRGRAVVRTMPNTSSTIGLGATGISFSPEVTDKQRELARTIFSAVGIASVVEEPLLEAVTAVSGTGPAYVYYLMEAMMAAGVELGLTGEAARELTVQTVRGAAEMVRLTGENPADLRRKVTSPGGTTQAAIETLERYRFQEGMHAAVRRCAERALEMGGDIRREAEAMPPLAD